MSELTNPEAILRAYTLVSKENTQLTESNRQLREELEETKEKVSKYWNSIAYMDQKLARTRIALAAAKEALEYAQHRARCEYALTTDEIPTIKTNYDNALALITECEKETT